MLGRDLASAGSQGPIGRRKNCADTVDHADQISRLRCGNVVATLRSPHAPWTESAEWPRRDHSP